MKDIINKLDNILNEGHLGQMADRVELDHEVQHLVWDLHHPLLVLCVVVFCILFVFLGLLLILPRRR